jgi:thiamine-phosphate pyrophosphorylase
MIRYAITDRRVTSNPGCDSFARLINQAGRLAAEKVDFLQLREKDLEAKELIGLTRRIITAVQIANPVGGRTLRVLVNGRPDVVLAAGADGVHLPSGREQLTVGQARTLLEAKAIISVACHSLAEVRQASGDGADLILFSPVFGKTTANGEFAGAGLELLAEACRAAGNIPVLALGGVTKENAQLCIDAGARGVAGIRLFL